MLDSSGLSERLRAADKLSTEDFLRAYRIMYCSRRIDDRGIILKRRNQTYFQVAGAGHEAVQTAAGMALRPGTDWFFPYYRSQALCLALGVNPLDMLLQAVGAGSDPASGGRQMPTHWSFPNLNIVSTSSCTGTQYVHAVGSAHAARLQAEEHEAEELDVTLVASGEGATSEGEFWEAVNAACLERAPVLFLIEDNGYAISVPVEYQTAGGSISRLVSAFPGLEVYETDGLDFAASYETMAEAARHCRTGGGPALVHAHVVRPYGHSLSDDESLYKTSREKEREREADPVQRFAEFLEREGYADEDALLSIHESVDRELEQAVDRALEAEPPRAGSATNFVYSPNVDPTSAHFRAEARTTGDPKTMVDMINVCLRDEMRRDRKIVVFGEDVADCSREQALSQVSGKGGVFKVTHGLQREFGGRRVFNSPIAEAAIVGRALGMAVRGWKPVVEIQFFDYIWPAMMQIRDELAVLRWRSNNTFAAPVVIRIPIGGYLGGGAVYHSQSGECVFTHIPGLRVVFPSNAADANGLLRTAIRCEDPVLFLEHKKLYRETYNRSPYPGPDYMIPFGSAARVREGKDLTVVTYGALVQRAQLAAAKLEKQSGVSIEILDLRSLSPYDWESISASVSKTNRVVVAHEDCLSWGYGAELSARIARELFDELDAPVGRVGALDTFVAYSPSLEREILPQTEDLEREMERVLRY